MTRGEVRVGDPAAEGLIAVQHDEEEDADGDGDARGTNHDGARDEESGWRVQDVDRHHRHARQVEEEPQCGDLAVRQRANGYADSGVGDEGDAKQATGDLVDERREDGKDDVDDGEADDVGGLEKTHGAQVVDHVVLLLADHPHGQEDEVDAAHRGDDEGVDFGGLQQTRDDATMGATHADDVLARAEL